MKSILDKIVPTQQQADELQTQCDALCAAANQAMADIGLTGEATVQGSVAKQTWLAGDADVDLFLLLDPELSQDELRAGAEKVGHQILSNPLKKYAQHPYVIGQFDGLEVDLVPAYKVPAASAHMSAVDRTPFHTAWVLEHASEVMRNEVRLAKKWCKGTEIYGADTATGGFSGYLVEVLCIALGGFEKFVAWLAADAKPRRIAIGDDLVTDHVSPLVVVDPVDAGRNCAAAVSEITLAAAAEAGQAYIANPTESFFFPAPRRDEPEARAAELDSQKRAWIPLVMQPQTDRLDIVLPQFQKAARVLCDGFVRAGFPLYRHRVDVIDGDVCLQFLVDDLELPETLVNRGPPVDRRPNNEKFIAKWKDHPDRVGEIGEDNGLLAVTIKNHARTPGSWLRQELPRFQAGKHVAAALKHHTIPDAPSASWAPIVTDFVLGRRPWQR